MEEKTKKVTTRDTLVLLKRVVKLQEGYSDNLSGVVDALGVVTQFNKNLIPTLRLLSRSIVGLTFFVSYLFWRVVLGDLVANFFNTTFSWWQGLSEGWQIALVMFVLGIPTTIGTGIAITVLSKKINNPPSK